MTVKYYALPILHLFLMYGKKMSHDLTVQSKCGEEKKGVTLIEDIEDCNEMIIMVKLYSTVLSRLGLVS